MFLFLDCCYLYFYLLFVCYLWNLSCGCCDSTVIVNKTGDAHITQHRRAFVQSMGQCKSSKRYIFWGYVFSLRYPAFLALDIQNAISAREQPAAARLLRSWVRIPPGPWIFVCCGCRVLSGGGLCDELITRPEESYRLWCVVVCDLETSRMGAPYIYIWH